jgi:hypothetical protein
LKRKERKFWEEIFATCGGHIGRKKDFAEEIGS